MLRALSAAALIVCVCASAPAVGQDQPALPDGGGRISGKVVDPGARSGVGGVLVTVRLAGYQPRTTRTDNQGQFLITRLPPGLFSVTAAKDGYLSGVAGATRPNGFGHPVPLADDEMALLPNVPIWRFGGISGRVADETGKSLAGVRVYVLTRALVGGREMFRDVATAVTGLDGTYAMGRLPPGAYSVAALRDGLHFVGGGTVPDASPSFTIESGTVIHNADVDVPHVTTVSISGRVFGPDGSADGVVVALEPARPFSASILDPHGVSTAGEGAFTMRGVPPGDYVLRAWQAPNRSRDGDDSPAPGADGPLLFAEMPISIGEQSIGDLALTLRRAPGITGVVQFSGNAQPDDDAPRGLQIVLLSPGAAASRPAAVASLDVTGRFTFTDVAPGRYQIGVVAGGQLSNWFLRSAMANGRDVSDEPFDLSSDLRGVTVTMADQPTVLTGTATFRRAPDYAVASVLIFPADRARWPGPGVAMRRFARLRVANNAPFAFTGLPAGSYFVAAIDDDDVSGEWMTRETLDLLTRVASRVDVSEQSMANVLLNVASMPGG